MNFRSLRTCRNAGLLGLVFALLFVAPVLSHGDEPRVEIGSDQITPGGVIEVRGVDFERDKLVTLMLVSGNSAIPLGEITADVEGIFLHIVTVPVDLPEGTYNFLAITDDHNVTSPDLIVQGAPVLTEGEGGQGPRDEDDALLAPMPTYPPGIVPGGVLPATAPSAVQEPPASNRDPAVFLAIALLLGILVVLGVRMAPKR